MKKYIIILITVLIANSFTSCEGDLELNDPTRLGKDQFIIDGQTANEALLKAYDDMQSRYVAGVEPIMLQGLYADDLIQRGSFPDLAQMLVNNVLTDNISLSRMFSNHYDIINTTSEVIRLTNGLDDLDITDTERLNVTSEAHALRAFAYFQLVRVFGGLPITENTVPLDGIDANNTPRSSENEVYDYILNEISLAEGNLPNNPTTRFSNNAVLVLKAKVQIALGQYSDAKNTLTPLIGTYNLTSSYGEMFGFGSGSNSAAILTVDYTNSDGNSLNFFLTPSGRLEVSPSQSLLNAFESGDTRINKIANNSNLDNAYINKYVGGAPIPYIYRYADVLLMYAEVLARENNPDASTYINLVRTRAGIGTIGTFNSSNVESIIAQERRVEFYGEPDRWYDVKRLGFAQQVIESKGLNFQSKHLLWPIPQDEIDANDSISQDNQNPGY